MELLDSKIDMPFVKRKDSKFVTYQEVKYRSFAVIVVLWRDRCCKVGDLFQTKNGLKEVIDS